MSGEPPVHRSRAKNLVTGLALVAGAVALWLTVNTAVSLYGGLGDHSGERRVQSGITAHILGCTRHGPVSTDGIGFWWRCHAVVPRAGGGTAETVLGPSVAGPSDVGKDIAVRSDCDNDGGDCNYGNDRSQLWGDLIKIIAVVFYGAGFIAGLIGLAFLHDAVRPGRRPPIP